MRTLNKPKSAAGHRGNLTKSKLVIHLTLLIDRFKSLHNSGRFVNNNGTGITQLY
jgi:hypothetical protein